MEKVDLRKIEEPAYTGINVSERLLSIDFLRGFIMVLLALESTELYIHLTKASDNSFIQSILIQFFHHPWHGLRFWDLVQPIFMFTAGVSMAMSLKKQKTLLTWRQSFLKTLKRCALLFFWGVTDYLVREKGLSFELWDILTQLSFTTLVAFLIAEWSIGWQFVTSAICLILPEILYRFIHIPGFDKPFIDQHNFGNYIDWILMRKINPDGWVAINCISTSAHTIWGLIAGRIILSKESSQTKLIRLLGLGLILLALGFGLDWTGITPIIKRIATSSFVLASGGFCLLFLSLSYYWVDISKHQKNLEFFKIVGMNSIFIYLFFEIVGDRWFNGYINAISGGLLQIVHVPIVLSRIISSLCIFSLEWGLCYFLYTKKIFFKV